MNDGPFVRTLIAALIGGLGVIVGVVLFPFEGFRSWIFGGGLIAIGIGLAAAPAFRRRPR